jgi:hypothetical protein
MAESSFTIAPCTDREWSDKYPHQIDVEGYDGNGWMEVAVPMTTQAIDALIVLLQEYRQNYIRTQTFLEKVKP